MSEQINKMSVERASRPWVGGLVMVLVGVYFLAVQLFHLDLGEFFLPGLALIFIAWGLLSRQVGLLIPGGILAGIGAGAYLVENLFSAGADNFQGGMFLLSLAGGFGLITVLSLVLKSYNAGTRAALWALIPAAILGLIGALLVAGGSALQALEVIGQGWPVVMIVIGLYIILRRNSMR